MDKLIIYRNNICLQFEEHGDNFSLNVPHKPIWDAIIRFLRKRGFKVTENPSYKEHYDTLSKYHKIGFKNNVACLMEISSWQIEIEFGSIKNLWTGIAQSFWSDKSDNRYTKLSYLEETAVKLEIKRLSDYLQKYNFENIDHNKKLSPEEYIIDNLKSNTHIHGKVNCLNDIKLSIENGVGKYNSGGNSSDRNKKQIICGDLKYYYDYNRRLCCGIAWHNINNMWWVIAGGSKRNIACFDLFDFDSTLPKRKPVTLDEMLRVLKRYEAKQDYQRCLHIKKYIDNKFSEEIEQKKLQTA